MSSILLQVSPNEPITEMSEILAYGMKMLLVGMGIVFSVLALLCVVLLIFKSVFGAIGGKQLNHEAKAPAAAPTTVSIPVSDTADEEIVAVIAAAIAAASSENPNKSFRVVSFKRL
jgi:sodium pump decarboxylase gamma subunit